MRYNVLVATALLAVWGCQPPVDQTDAGAEYCLVTPVIALGRIAAKEDPQVATFRLKNRTSAPVRIREIRKSCTCFAVRMSAEQVPAQGESGFDVTVAADTPGKHSASVTILLDDEKKTALQAVLSWEVTAAYTSGGSSVDFGNVLVGEVAYRQVELTRECDHCTLRAVETGGNGIKITSVQESEGRVKVNVVLESSLEARNYHGTLRIKVSNAWPESYNIPVRWTVREEIAAVPRRLSLGSGPSEQWLAGKVVLTDYLNRRCRVEIIETECDAGVLKVESQELPSGGLLLHVTLSAEGADRIVPGIVRVRLSQPLPKSVEIPITAYFSDARPEERDAATKSP